MTERKPKGEKWDSFVERQIRAAQESGEFDDLPGFGKPLPDIDEPYDEMWWLKKKIKRENLSLAPPAIQIRCDLEITLKCVMELTSESDVRDKITALNERIRRANLAAVWGPPCTTMPVDLEQVLAEWRHRNPEATP